MALDPLSSMAETEQDRKFASSVVNELIIRCVQNSYLASKDEEEAMASVGKQTYYKAGIYGLGTGIVVYVSLNPAPIGRFGRFLVSLAFAASMVSRFTDDLSALTIAELIDLPDSRMSTELKIIMAEMEGIQGPFQKRHHIRPIDLSEYKIREDAVERLNSKPNEQIVSQAPKGLFISDQNVDIGLYHLISEEDRVGDRKDNRLQSESPWQIIHRMQHEQLQRMHEGKMDRQSHSRKESELSEVDATEEDGGREPFAQSRTYSGSTSRGPGSAQNPWETPNSSVTPSNTTSEGLMTTEPLPHDSTGWNNTHDNFHIGSDKFVSSDNFAEESREPEFINDREDIDGLADDLDAQPRGSDLSISQQQATERRNGREPAKSQQRNGEDSASE